jgi:hypothetical protein
MRLKEAIRKKKACNSFLTRLGTKSVKKNTKMDIFILELAFTYGMFQFLSRRLYIIGGHKKNGEFE